MLNQVTLIGNLTRDAEFSPAEDGKKARVVFTAAVNERFYADGEKQERTAYPRIVAFGKVAERLEGLCSGQQVSVHGKLSTGKYEKDGTTHYTTEVIASLVVPAQHTQAPESEPDAEAE